VIAAVVVCLMGGTSAAQDYGLDSRSTTGPGDMPEFNFDDGEMPDSWQPGPGGGAGPGFGPGQRPDEFLKVMLAVYGFVIAVAIAAVFVIRAVTCWLLWAPLATLPEHCREMQPWQVWLMMIPCFDLVWTFFVSQRVSQSFRNYFAETGRTEFGDCGAQIGLWWSICLACSIIPCVNYIAGPAQLVLLIIFLVKIWGLKAEVAAVTSSGTA
jgi:hypothetical protein